MQDYCFSSDIINKILLKFISDLAEALVALARPPQAQNETWQQEWILVSKANEKVAGPGKEDVTSQMDHKGQSVWVHTLDIN